ncbi:MAG: putative molybdenum carrier protein [Proteobacteria bacterium]|nr:putative molybdenum carrier protein [Pseudomonadota bacterium]
MPTRSYQEFRIITGGQTGVDRGALDAALAAGIPCGGWCPDGRKAEDGVIPARYPVQVLPGAGYSQRTRQNVIDSDATLILYFGELEGGTAQTLTFCRRFGKPMRVLDLSCLNPDAAAERVRQFLHEQRIRILNVAGPRASKVPEAAAVTTRVLGRVLPKPARHPGTTDLG